MKNPFKHFIVTKESSEEDSQHYDYQKGWSIINIDKKTYEGQGKQPEEKIVVRDKEKIVRDKKEEDYDSGVEQWAITENTFRAIGKTTKELPPGYYTYDVDIHGTLFFIKIKVVTDDILILPDLILNNILDDFKKFWSSKEIYEKYEYVFKRAYLMYGPAGCGKTSLISLLSKELIKLNGIVINIHSYQQFEYFNRAIKDIREIEKEKPLIIIIEDIDGYVNGDKSLISRILNILDGSYQTDNVIIIATTNYPDRLEERITSRPSRFDVRVYLGVPSPDVRRFYIKSKLHPSDLKKISLNEWVKLTEGFTLDHLKELILLTFVLQNDFKESLEKVKDMINNSYIKPVSLKSGNNGMGFKK
jgi:hypothetical protein